MKYNHKKELQPHRVEEMLRFADDFGDKNRDIVYCAEESIFYIWEDNYFRPMLDVQTKKYLLNFEEVTYFKPHQFKQFKDNLAVFKQREIKEFNAMDILDFENGVLHLKTGEFTQHDKEYLSTIRIPYKYNKEDKCPVWIDFLSTSLENDPVRIAVLQEYMGYCLGRDNGFHKALVLIGEGRNGKGTTFHVINRIIGEKNCSALKLGDMRRIELVSDLVGKLVNIDGDTDTSAVGFESDFRRITAGDGIIARRLYKDAFKFYPYCKLVVGANDLPRIADKTHGFYDRLIIIPYNVSFVGREDRNLKNKLDSEIGGILNWALSGRKRLYDQGRFSVDKTMEDYVADLKKENNPIELYLDEKVGVHDDARTTKKAMYEEYFKWCEDNGHKPLSKIKFSKEFYRLMKGKTKKDARDMYDAMWPNIYIKGSANEPVKTEAWQE